MARPQIIEGEAISEHAGAPVRVIWLPDAVVRALSDTRRYPKSSFGVQRIDLLLTNNRYVPSAPVMYQTLMMLPAASFEEFGYSEIRGIAPPER